MRSSLGQGKMWVAQDFFSISLGVEQAKRRIRDELCRFSVITNPPKTAFQESKRTYSGKVAGVSYTSPIKQLLVNLTTNSSVCRNAR